MWQEEWKREEEVEEEQVATIAAVLEVMIRTCFTFCRVDGFP